jgi:hypothetical protein
MLSAPLSPEDREKAQKLSAAAEKGGSGHSLVGDHRAEAQDATRAASPRKQGRKRRNPRGFLLEGFCETNPSELLRRERLAPTLGLEPRTL